MKSSYDSIENEDKFILAERFQVLKVMDGKAGTERSLFDSFVCNSNSLNDGSPSCSSASSVSCSSSAGSTHRHKLGDDDCEATVNNRLLDNDNAATTSILNHIRQAVALNRTSPSHTQNSSPMQLSPPRPVPSKPPSFDVGRLINKEMLKYDQSERNAIYEEVHGVACLCPDESEPGILEAALKDMECELAAIPTKQKAAYLQSLRFPDSYVHKRDFKLRFLRFELFDPHRAAVRMMLCLENFLEFFGTFALKRPIRLSDFSKQEYKVFAAGRIQMLPFRDRGGRRIFVGFPCRDHQFFDPRIRVKIHIYLWWVASNCIETQRKGMVVIIFHDESVCDTVSNNNNNNNNNSSNNNKFCDANQINSSEIGIYDDRNRRLDWDEQQEQHYQNPDDDNNNNTRVSLGFAKLYMHHSPGLSGRVVSIHLCTPDTPYFSVVRTFFAAMLGLGRSRLQSHVGHNIENRYKLNGFGIATDQFPLTESGKIKTTHFRKWIQMQRNVENAARCHPSDRSFSDTIECPLSNDVLFRPSQSMMNHPGNAKFRGLVESKHLEHSLAPTRDIKIEITKGVMRLVQKAGGRFLVWSKDVGWVKLTEEKQVYAKIAVFFRNSKVTARAKMSCQSTKSSTYIFAGEKRSDNSRITGGEPRSEDDYVTAGSTLSESCMNFKRRKIALPVFSSM